MQDNYEDYLERIQGVILEHNYDGSSHFEHKSYFLKILVNDPFNAEISIIMNIDIWNKYVSYSASRYWRGVSESHPENYENLDSYFNLQDCKFYTVSTIDDKNDPVWRESNLEGLINLSRSAWRFSRHIHVDYNRFHTGQTCEFYAYAKDRNNRFYKPSTIDQGFSKYKWIYNPLTFKAHEITSESVEHLITKMQIPKLVANKIIQKCKSEKKRCRKEARQQWKIKVKTKFSNLWKRFMKQEPPINVVWKSVAIINGIIAIWIAIWALFLKDK